MFFKRFFHSAIQLQKNYYRILNLDEKANKRAIKLNYYKLSKKYHPDLNPNNKKAHQSFLEINEAYAVLGNEANKKKYDLDLNNDTNENTLSKHYYYPATKGSSSSTHAWTAYRNRRAPRTTGSQSAQAQAEKMKWKQAGGGFNYTEHYHRHYEAEEYRRRERMENAAKRRRAAGEENIHPYHPSSMSGKTSDIGHTWGRIWRLGVVLTGIAYVTQIIT
ncbi:DnaJ domain-containing protein [Cokeromyces recurvatus]|uniref:DnaJ domain-containing protein n=1 Tax=Cokeromyces recurvatus TaxID=90255 RepID=UPI002220A57B|nr:DnaJ domain-containing protein [Cokeromyces recurvatus]KAI7904327.1 DnaJ domain-containing protein [Cokeromyces recurvatus]